jgi:hypothetical protein
MSGGKKKAPQWELFLMLWGERRGSNPRQPESQSEGLYQKIYGLQGDSWLLFQFFNSIKSEGYKP